MKDIQASHPDISCLQDFQTFIPADLTDVQAYLLEISCLQARRQTYTHAHTHTHAKTPEMVTINKKLI